MECSGGGRRNRNAALCLFVIQRFLAARFALLSLASQATLCNTQCTLPSNSEFKYDCGCDWKCKTNYYETGGKCQICTRAATCSGPHGPS